MEQEEEIKRPLFIGMTRPPMIAGVTFNYFVVNSMIGIVAFLGTGQLPLILISLPTHAIGYMICLKDPNIFEVIAVKILKCMQCVNRRFWNDLNSYSPW